MSNFAFIPQDFRGIAEAAQQAERLALPDPRSSCFRVRFALEAMVHWLYRHDPALTLPYDTKLGTLVHEPSFQNLLPEAIYQKVRVIQRQGNEAVHSPRPVRQYDALQVLKGSQKGSLRKNINFSDASKALRRRKSTSSCP